MDTENHGRVEQTPPTESINVYDLGQRPAFILQPKLESESVHPARDIIRHINKLRAQAMIAVPQEDGTIIGYISSAEQIQLLKESGFVTLGVSRQPSIVRVDDQGHISLTSDALLACVRGNHAFQPGDTVDNGTMWSTTELEDETTMRVKDTRLHMVLKDELQQFTKPADIKLPDILTQPENETIQTELLKKGYMVKVDINNFSSQSENEEFLKQCLTLLSSIETELAQLQHDRIHIGQVAGDALTFFFDNMFSSRSIEKAIAQALIKNPSLKVKTTGYSLGENVILAKDENNRVFYADQVVLYDTIQTKEKAAKDTHQRLEGASLIDIAEGKTELYGSAIIWDLDRSLTKQSIRKHIQHSTALPRRQFEMPSTLAA